MDTQKLHTITKSIVDLMIASATVEVKDESGIYKIEIKTSEADAPSLIGRHGDTIRSLQRILEVACFKQTGTRVELVVNVNDYREKQVERLHGIASEIVARVHEGGRGLPFRGLNAYERRIIHEYITTTHPDLSTYSVGEGRHRELIIDLKSNGEGSYNAHDDSQNFTY